MLERTGPPVLPAVGVCNGVLTPLLVERRELVCAGARRWRRPRVRRLLGDPVACVVCNASPCARWSGSSAWPGASSRWAHSLGRDVMAADVRLCEKFFFSRALDETQLVTFFLTFEIKKSVLQMENQPSPRGASISVR